jgi:NHL repeat
MLAIRRSFLLAGLLLIPLLNLFLTGTPSHAQSALVIVPFADVPQARGVTIDAAGNVFSISRDTGIVYKITPAGQVSIIADLPDISGGYVGPVFDPASGNLFVGKNAFGSSNEVLKITPAGAVSIFALVQSPSGLAADGQGNLFVTSYVCPDGALYKISANGVVSLLGTGLCHPDGVAIGSNGDLFVGDRGSQRIMRMPAAGGAASVFAIGVGLPLGVAFDQTGTLFVTDYSSGTISSINANGVLSPFASGLSNPNGLVFNQQNKIYIANYGTNQIVTLENAPPPTPPIADDLTINGGALTTTAGNVRLDVSAANADGSTNGLSMSFSNDGTTWGKWQGYVPWTLWQLTGGDGMKMVYGRVKNGAGAISAIVSDTIELDTGVQSEYSVTINNGALYTNKIAVQLTISARPHTAAMQISNDGGFLGVPWEPYRAHKAWQITRYHDEEITRLVYVRFRDTAGIVSSLYLDDIILDTDAPHGHGSVADSGALLELTATDNLSGVDSMRVGAQPDFGDATWEPFSAQRAWDFGANPTAYVQFRDAADNLSPRYAVAAAGSSTLFLPLVLR